MRSVNVATEDLNQRIARLESIEAIKQLKAAYCALCDNGYPADELVQLFTEDAVWDGGPTLGQIRGHEALRAFFASVPPRKPWAAHLVMNPVIEVDGDRATAVWQLVMPHNVRSNGTDRSRWQLGTYNDEYVRVDGRWLIKTLKVESMIYDSSADIWVRG